MTINNIYSLRQASTKVLAIKLPSAGRSWAERSRMAEGFQAASVTQAFSQLEDVEQKCRVTPTSGGACVVHSDPALIAYTNPGETVPWPMAALTPTAG